MKAFSLIMVLIMSVLFSLPCADRSDACETNLEVYQVPHSHANDTNDACSPFCHCVCCSISITAFQFMIPEVNQIHHRSDNTNTRFSNEHIRSNYLSSIWQPPKFSV